MPGSTALRPPRRAALGLSGVALTRGLARAAAWVLGKPPLVVGFLYVLSAAVVASFTTQITSFEPDEIGYTHLAIALSDHPSLFTTQFGGGDRLNQLYPLTLAPLYGLFGNVKAYELAHVWNAVLMSSAVIPAYLLARQALARRGAAYIAAALVAVAPWFTMASVQLTEVAGYPAATWALWAMARALIGPSRRADLVAFALIGLASYARLQLIVLAPVFVAAVFAHELGYLRREGFASVRKRLLGPHLLMTLAAAAGVLVGIPLAAGGVLSDAFGFYGNTLNGTVLPPGTWDLARSNLVFMAVGIGLLPMALTFGLVVDAVVAPRERRTHAFAVLAGLTIVAITIQVARTSVIFNAGVVQERYMLFLAPVLAVGFVAALLDARRPAAAVLTGGALLVALVATADYLVVPSAFWFMVSPGMTFFFEVLAPRLGRVNAWLGDAGASRFVTGAVVTAIGLLAFAAVLRVAGRRRALGAATVLLVAAGATQTVYSLNRVVHGNDNGPGLGSGSVEGRDWVDSAVGETTPVVVLSRQLGQINDSRERWWESEFWNRSVAAAQALSQPYTTWNSARPTQVDRETGAIDVSAVSDHMVASASGYPLGLRGDVVGRSPERDMELVRTGRRPRAAWLVTGASDDGWLRLGRPASLTIFRTTPGCRRVRLRMALPAGIAESRRVVVRGAGARARTTLRAGGPPQDLALTACGGGRRALRLSVGAAVPAGAGYPGLTPQIRSVGVRPA